MSNDSGITVRALVNNVTNEVGLTEGNARAAVLGTGTVGDVTVGRSIFGRNFTLSIEKKFIRGIAIHRGVAATLRRVGAAVIMSVAVAASAQAMEVGGPRSAPQPPSMAPKSNEALPPWTAGYLYIHHISTGRGNAAYIVMPDGTTMLIDAGETDQEFSALARGCASSATTQPACWAIMGQRALPAGPSPDQSKRSESVGCERSDLCAVG